MIPIEENAQKILAPTPASPHASDLTDAHIQALLGLAIPVPNRHTMPPLDVLRQEFPGYEIVAKIGEGGMAVVYHALQKCLNRPVALKILPPENEDADPLLARRFEQEASLMSRLCHPGIVQIFDAGISPGGLRYFAMELIEGDNLAQILEKDLRIAPERALHIFRQVCQALIAAHADGIIHRDIKPSNIILATGDRVKVTDFGIAAPVWKERGTTLTGMLVGTPDFTPPEAFLAATRPDHRGDIFALGVSFYRALTGQMPRGKYSPASTLVPGLPRRFDEVIGKALAAAPTARYQSAEELLNALNSLVIAHKRRRSSHWAFFVLSCAALALAGYWRISYKNTALPEIPHSQPVSPATRPVIDLLPLIALDQNSISGTWLRLANGDLVCLHNPTTARSEAGLARLEIPYYPPEEYDFEVEYTPSSVIGSGVGQIISVAGYQTHWLPGLRPPQSQSPGFGDLDCVGKTCTIAGWVPSEVRPLAGKRNISKVEVRRDALRAFSNGTEWARWTGAVWRFSLGADICLRDPFALGICVLKNDYTVIHRATLREITGSGRDAAKGFPGFPRRVWTSVYHTEDQGTLIAANATWENGWITPKKSVGNGIALPPAPGHRGVNWGARARFRWSNQVGSRAVFTLRKNISTLTGKEVSKGYFFELNPHVAEFYYCADGGLGDRSVRTFGTPLALKINDGDEVTIETFVVGNALLARINGSPLFCEADASVTAGVFEISSFCMAFRDLAFVNLDGLTETEARRYAGMPESSPPP